MFAVGFAAVLWLFKEVPFLYAAEPWRDDPYDAFVSFAIAAIPLVGAAALVRLASCRRSEPLPVRRLWELIALARTATTIALVVIAVEWASVLLRANRGVWQPTTVAVLVILGGCSAAAVGSSSDFGTVRRVYPAPPRRNRTCCLTPSVSRFGSPWFWVHSPRRARRMIVWCDRRRSLARRHPLLAAAAVASIMGIGFAIPKIVFERYRPSLAAFVFVVSACSFFALVVVVAARFGLVAQHSAHPRYGHGHGDGYVCGHPRRSHFPERAVVDGWHDRERVRVDGTRSALRALGISHRRGRDRGVPPARQQTPFGVSTEAGARGVMCATDQTGPARNDGRRLSPNAKTHRDAAWPQGAGRRQATPASTDARPAAPHCARVGVPAARLPRTESSARTAPRTEWPPAPDGHVGVRVAGRGCTCRTTPARSTWRGGRWPGVKRITGITTEPCGSTGCRGRSGSTALLPGPERARIPSILRSVSIAPSGHYRAG